MNAPSAEFCWSCLQVMGAPAAAAPTPETNRRLFLESDTVPVEPGHFEGQLDVSVDLPFQTRKRSRVTIPRILGLMLFVVVAVFAAQEGVDRWKGDVSAFPTSVGGFQNLTDPATLQFQSAYFASAPAALGAGKAETRFYGSETGQPQIQLIWAREPGTDAAALLAQLSLGARDPQIQPVEIAGQTFSCTQALPTNQEWISDGSSGGVCGWASGDYAWILVSKAADTEPQVLANSAAVGRGVSTFMFVGMWGALALVAALLALRLVLRVLFH